MKRHWFVQVAKVFPDISGGFGWLPSQMSSYNTAFFLSVAWLWLC
jgi:hypothetical protein